MNEYLTTWAKIEAPHGAFDDFIVVESLVNQNRFYFRPEEFDNLMTLAFHAWQNGEIQYFQTLKEWNECTGFQDIECVPSTIENPIDFIKALEKLNGSPTTEFGKISNEDILAFRKFLQLNTLEGFKIWEV